MEREGGRRQVERVHIYLHFYRNYSACHVDILPPDLALYVCFAFTCNFRNTASTLLFSLLNLAKHLVRPRRT